ncbi:MULTISPECIES: PqqD family protein [unclassified Lebetimonas]|uniref:PqqD family protein n=1 Tax=unclassified Lebetimonas TaxID=2648158 RepID=UPI0004641A83|nr:MULTISPECIES: PqqD family protein [unclassified Lebetimonas]
MLINEMVIDENNMGFIPSLGITFQLNDTAKRIIELIKEGKNKDEIISIISSETNKDWREVYIDVNDFFQKLKIYGLINENSN